MFSAAVSGDGWRIDASNERSEAVMHGSVTKPGPGMLALAGLILALVLPTPAAVAADPAARLQPVPERRGSTAANPGALVERHLQRVAALQLLRAAFDVVPMASVSEILGLEAERLAARGPDPADIAALDVALLAETSYYIVSLRYLVESGGAIWPDDRPERFYANDSLVELAGAQQALLEVIAQRSDPLPLLIRINRVHAWTEAFAEIPPRFDFFSERDALVEAAMNAYESSSRT